MFLWPWGFRIEFNSYGTTRGHSLKLMKKRASTNLRHHFFSERGINNWNNLDNKTVTSRSINIFKGNLERLRQSKEIDLFVGNWCYLLFWNWAVPSVRPRPVSFPVSLKFSTDWSSPWYRVALPERDAVAPNSWSLECSDVNMALVMSVNI